MRNNAQKCITLALFILLLLGLIGCTAGKASMTAQEAMDALESSLKFTEDEMGARKLTYAIPDYRKAGGFIIRVSGHQSDGAEISYYDEKEGGWEAGESVSFSPESWGTLKNLDFTAELEEAQPIKVDVLSLYRQTYDETLYEKLGLTIAIPNEYIDQLLIFTNSESETNLISVYEKRSYEESMADHGFKAGAMFSIARYTQAQYELVLSTDGSGKSFFARDDNYYYSWVQPTDVQFYRSGNDNLDTGSDGWNAWIVLHKKRDEIGEDFIARNNLTAYSDSEFRDREFTYDGQHLYVLYYPYYAYPDTAAVRGMSRWDNTYTLVLSQPAAQGETGIWCVERWYDNDYGNLYYEFPYETGLSAADYYSQLQSASDSGDDLFRLDPVQIALEYAHNRFNHSLATEASFRRVEGVPAGNVLKLCNQVFSDMGTLQPADIGSAGEIACRDALEVPQYLRPLQNFAGSSLGDIVWLKAEEPSSLSGGVVYCRNADNTKMLSFYQQDNLLCVDVDGTERWYKPAYNNSQPFRSMLGFYDEFYRYYNPEPTHSYSNDEVDAAFNAVRAFMFPGCTLTQLSHDPAASYQAAGEYLRSRLGQHGISIDNIIVVCANFTTDANQTDLRPDSAYEGYKFILIRDDAVSPWRVDDHGE